MSANNVQTLNKKRGRPKSAAVQLFRSLNPELKARSSIYGRSRSCKLVVTCCKLQLTDGDLRDAATHKRMMTKVVELSRIFPGDFWETAEGEAWLRENWSVLVSLTAADIIAWVRDRNDRARKGADE